MSDTAIETETAHKTAELIVQGETTPVVPATAQKRSFLNKSQAELERAIAHYPDRAREATVWVQGFCREECKGNIELLRSIADKLGYKYSQSYFYNVIYGHYFKIKKGADGKSRIDGNVDAWAELVAALRKHDQQNTAAGKLGFIETPTYRCIYNFITERRAPGAACRWGGITGPTGAQKSECAKYYKLLHNHGRTVYLEAPAHKTLAAFQRKLASQYGAPIRSTRNAQESEIRDNVDADKCIIIDNAQRLYVPGKGNAQPIFDYLLELQDDTGCCVILFFTEDFVKGDLFGSRAMNYFEQFIGRMGGVEDLLRLPEFTPASDLKAIARAFGLNPGEGAMEWLRKWSRLPGRVRLVFHRLRRARQFAQLDGRDRIQLVDLEEANNYIPPAIGDDTEE